ncbi:MAG: peptidoglycan-binding protein [Bacteroidota bacterium]
MQGALISASLEKLKITAFKDETFKDEKKSFEVKLNPTEYSRNFQIKYNDDEAQGDSARSPKFNSYDCEEMSFKFMLDSTGAVNPLSYEPVVDQIKNLTETVYNYDGSEHEPSYVEILWGTLIFRGRLSKMSVKYPLFKPSGEPIRAEVDISFKSFIDNKEKAAAASNSSPDLTHVVTIKEGDTLPLLCFSIYKDSGYYLQVAEANGLKNFRALEPGDKIFFPPLVD